MKLVLGYLQGKEEKWVAEPIGDYEKRIQRFVPFEQQPIPSKKLDRDDREQKLKAEEEKILKAIAPGDHLILFDERGRSFKSSVDFSQYLVKKFESSAKRIVFIIGGPYGFSDAVRARAQDSISLSPLTLNHHLARLTAIEQIYRALTIWKNVPYHND